MKCTFSFHVAAVVLCLVVGLGRCGSGGCGEEEVRRGEHFRMTTSINYFLIICVSLELLFPIPPTDRPEIQPFVHHPVEIAKPSRETMLFSVLRRH